MSRKEWVALKDPPLSEAVLDVVEKFGFPTMTPVQTAVIPLLLSRKDVSAEAVTGSGKTLAFVVPLFEILMRRHRETPWTSKEIGALIISPTRDLVFQISGVVAKFLEHPEFSHLKQQNLVGGNNILDDIQALKKVGPCILICTPGRLEDLLQRKGDLNLAARVKSLEFLVLDEADRLLDMGFKSTINSILNYLPRQRRTGLFSATQTNEVTDIIRAGLRNPVFVSVKEKSTINTPVLLQNFYKIVEPDYKFIELLGFLNSTASLSKVMIFFPTCACVEYWLLIIPHFLKQRKIFGIHGKMKNKRQNIVERFRNTKESILLSTDVLARGLDIPEIDWVIQWDPPASATHFVHRVGRTARQGSEGSSLIFLLPSEDAYVNFLKINQKVELKELKVKSTDAQINQEFKTTLNTIHKLQVSDKAIFDKGIRAFVSHIRAYTKHECNAILRLKDVDLGRVANCYGLLKMPRMPELKHSKAENFKGPDFEFDITTLSYKNQQKEQVRKEKMKIYVESGEWPGKKKLRKHSEPWEQTKLIKMDAKAKKELRKAKKLRKKENAAGKANETQPKKRKQKFSKEDLEELANDIRLFKKLKRNKISEEEFDKEMGLNDD